MNLEIKIFEFLRGLTNQSPVLDWFVVFIGQYFPYLLFLGALWFVLSVPEWKARVFRFAFLSLTAILSRGLITEAIRFFHDRPRPFALMEFTPLIDHAATAAFPSGHAAFYFALAFAMFMFSKKWGAWFFVGALLVGVARVIAGVHWPLDILGGAVVGIFSVWAVNKYLIHLK